MPTILRHIALALRCICATILLSCVLLDVFYCVVLYVGCGMCCVMLYVGCVVLSCAVFCCNWMCYVMLYVGCVVLYVGCVVMLYVGCVVLY